ncbi:MAG: radical SAM family heme chaperone HemW [Bdellovibrionales bacterium]
MIDSQFLNSSSDTPSSDIQSSTFGLYIHIPYCLQKCHYCDFVKFRVGELPPLSDYIKLLSKELKLKNTMGPKKIKTLYFGGGTPSLLSIDQISSIINDVKSVYSFVDKPEITLEINPGTLSLEDFKALTELGVNRFSLGIQTFNPLFLKACDREHSPEQTLKDLENMTSLNIDFSVDLLFGLPNQNLKQLDDDLEKLMLFPPKHVSPYNLTLPNQHFFNKNRANDQEQTEMMDLITKRLHENKIFRYELSNYAQEGFESQHNRGYWEDREYLGLGMGAHSYIKSSDWGTRLWNTGVYSKYEACIESPDRPHQKKEVLKLHEALTDFCHTSLRQLKGMSKDSLVLKFGQKKLPSGLWQSLSKLEQRGLISYNNQQWALTSTGFEIPNEVFRELCFLEEDLYE